MIQIRDDAIRLVEFYTTEVNGEKVKRIADVKEFSYGIRKDVSIKSGPQKLIMESIEWMLSDPGNSVSIESVPLNNYRSISEQF